MTTSPSTTPTETVQPSDFGDAEAFDLGEFAGYGSIEKPIAAARKVLSALASFENARPKVMFYFNGTPAVVMATDTNAVVHQDWAERRVAYQRAAGII